MPKGQNNLELKDSSKSLPSEPKKRGHLRIQFTIAIDWAFDFFGHLFDWLKRLFRGRVL